MDDLKLPDQLVGYAKALAMEGALGLKDTYPHSRHNQGTNYSPLTLLESADRIDPANASICGCIRKQFAGAALDEFVANVSGVVGDLHDNVWSHGLSTGLSMAQRWNKPKSPGECFFEFALADCGHGFLRELQRAGISQRLAITSDEAAIRWCITEGNTSKPSPDGWAQALPGDAVGNPIGGNVVRNPNGNHHLGLGLHKLVSLVESYSGQLFLASGDSMLTINQRGTHTYSRNATNWNGVALSCRFATDKVRERLVTGAQPDELGALLEQVVRGTP